MVVRLALLLGLAAALAACNPFAGFARTTPIPTASAMLHFTTIDLPRAGYCWNSGGQGECADPAGIEDLLRTGYLKPYRTAGGLDVKVIFHSSSARTGFSVNLIQGPAEKGSTVSETAPQTFRVDASPPAVAGTYIYVVTGSWPEGDVGFFLALDLIPGTA